MPKIKKSNKPKMPNQRAKVGEKTIKAILALKDKPVSATAIAKKHGVPITTVRRIFEKNGGRPPEVLNKIRGQSHKGKNTKHLRPGSETPTKLGLRYKKWILQFQKKPSAELLEMVEKLREEIATLRQEMKQARFERNRRAYYSARDKANRRQIKMNAAKAVLRERKEIPKLPK